ncbi:MAG: DUF3298 and DUF4163 domain-containing protein [Chloroflexi bacterium]|nr:DUF3298 and DUF4163 domain-containing protein [Chloroflexota bacterium]
MRSLLTLSLLVMLVITASPTDAQDDPCLSHGGMLDPDTGECHISFELSIDINYPLEFAEHSFARDAINSYIQQEQEAFLSVFEYGSFYSPGPLTLNIDYTIYERSDNISSILFAVDTYTGGAHPNLYYHTLVFDLANEEILGFEDVFQEEHDQLQTIRPIVIEDLNEQMAEFMPEGVWIDEETPREIFHDFVVTDEEIIFFFEPYAVAPYAAGPLSSSISLDVLEALLAPPFYQGN